MRHKKALVKVDRGFPLLSTPLRSHLHIDTISTAGIGGKVLYRLSHTQLAGGFLDKAFGLGLLDRYAAGSFFHGYLWVCPQMFLKTISSQI